jgi:predicted dehydrogenase
MNNSLDRRSFIKRAALVAGAVSTAQFLPASAFGRRNVPKDKLNCVQIGCGGRGNAHLNAAIEKNDQNLYAIVEPDEKKQASVLNWHKKKKAGAPKPQVFSDYREMFDKIGKNIDAVFIATPNHHHATAAMMAMQAGKNVYCEKPLVHDISEARRMREMAAENKSKLATQMGNQGHCMEGYISLCEYIAAGVIGNVTETHSWTNRANGGVGPRPKTEPVPAGMHWDAWIGPAPYRDFHSDLHPHEWHGWYDFGNGSIGNMGCHVLDGLYWALKIDQPTSLEVEQSRGGSDERYPTGCRIRWDVPARGEMSPVKVYWYEGFNENAKGNAEGVLRVAKGDDRNFPPLLHKLMEQYPDEDLDSPDSGTLYVGDKGIIYTATYGDKMHILPWAKMKETPAPAKTLPRPKDVFADFIEACLAGKTETHSPFEYGARLTEFAILGNLAQHVGPGHKLEWDPKQMKMKNAPELSAWIHRDPRDGWKVA